MTEQQALTRCVEAFERIATALETMARQQGEFLATMPAEEAAIVADEPEEALFPQHSPGCSARYSEFKDCTCPAEHAGQPHPYDATCACLACWTERRKAKRE